MDASEIKQRFHLLAWINQDLGDKGKAYGRYTMFRCPFHDDSDPSLAVYNDDGRWNCFGCGRCGDIFTWRQLREGMGFVDAVKDFRKRLGLNNKKTSTDNDQSKLPTACRINTRKPTSDWQVNAFSLIDICSNNLFDDRGFKARNWLHNRGLADDTLYRWKIGYLPSGLALCAYCDNRNGITIPWQDGERVWKVNIRRGVRKCERPKYRHIKGSKASLFGVQMMAGMPNCVVTEGELDALLLWQEIGDIADIVSLGGATNRLPDMWLPVLLHVNRFWIVTDNDTAGHKAADYWNQLTGERSKRLVPPTNVKDVTEAHQKGFDLRNWFQGVISIEIEVSDGR